MFFWNPIIIGCFAILAHFALSSSLAHGVPTRSGFGQRTPARNTFHAGSELKKSYRDLNQIQEVLGPMYDRSLIEGVERIVATPTHFNSKIIQPSRSLPSRVNASASAREFRHVVQHVADRLATPDALSDFFEGSGGSGVPKTFLGYVNFLLKCDGGDFFYQTPESMIVDIADFVFDQMRLRGVADFEQIIPDELEYLGYMGYGNVIPQGVIRKMEEFLDGILPHKIRIAEKSFRVKSVAAGVGGEVLRMYKTLYDALVRAHQNPRDWDIVFEAYDQSFMSYVYLKRGGPEILARNEAPSKAWNRPGFHKVVKPIYIDLTDGPQLERLTRQPADIVFSNRTIRHIPLGKRAPVIHALRRSIRKDGMSWLYISPGGNTSNYTGTIRRATHPRSITGLSAYVSAEVVRQIRREFFHRRKWF